MQKFFTVFLLCGTLFGKAQQLPSPFDSLTITGGKTPAETALNVGQLFLGKPYVAHTLDGLPTEQLVVNTHAFDCTTYLETVLALALAWHEVGEKNNSPLLEQSFRKHLTQFRYRNGRIEGYASRLHYFSEWLRDNERKGLVKDITDRLAGNLSVAKSITYMTSATYRYPALSDPATLKQISTTEAALSSQSFSFVPSRNVRQAEDQLQNGDIVMLTAARPGLDMKHVGLAIRQPDGRIHLLHASSDLGAVVITTYPLADYVVGRKKLSGIRVARLRQTQPPATAVLTRK